MIDGIRLKTKRIRLSEGYVTIRSLAPADNIAISEMLGDDVNSDAKAENAVVASSMIVTEVPDYNSTLPLTILDPEKPHNYILNPENPHNYITDPNDPSKTILDPEKPDNMILDPEEPDNFIPNDKVLKKTVLPPIKSYKDVVERMNFPLSDWLVIAHHAMLLNRPNPKLLGK